MSGFTDPEELLDDPDKVKYYRELQDQLNESEEKLGSLINQEIPDDYDDSNLQREIRILRERRYFLLSLLPPEEEEIIVSEGQIIYVDYENGSARFVNGVLVTTGNSWDDAFSRLFLAVNKYREIFTEKVLNPNVERIENGEAPMTYEEEAQIMSGYQIWVKANDYVQNNSTKAIIRTDFAGNELDTENLQELRHLRIYGGMREAYASVDDRLITDFTNLRKLDVSDYDNVESVTDPITFSNFNFNGHQWLNAHPIALDFFDNSDSFMVNFEYCTFDMTEADYTEDEDFDDSYQSGGGVYDMPELLNSLSIMAQCDNVMTFTNCTWENNTTFLRINRVEDVVQTLPGQISVDSIFNMPNATLIYPTFRNISWSIYGIQGFDDEYAQEFYGTDPDTYTSAVDSTYLYIEPLMDYGSISEDVFIENCTLNTNATELDGGDPIYQDSREGRDGGGTFFGRGGNGAKGGPGYDGGNGGGSIWGTPGTGGEAGDPDEDGEVGVAGEDGTNSFEDIDGITITQDDVYDFVSGNNFLYYQPSSD